MDDETLRAMAVLLSAPLGALHSGRSLPRPREYLAAHEARADGASPFVGCATPRTAWVNVDDLDRVKSHHFTATAQMEIGKRYATALIALLAKETR